MRFKMVALALAVLAALLAGCARQAEPQATQTPEPVPGVTLEPVPVEIGAADLGFGKADAAEALGFEEAAAKISADADAVYLFAANVGKGDALVLRVGDWIGLIDCGKTWARGRVETALDLMTSGLPSEDRRDLRGLFLTHTDDDHAGGLRWMANENIFPPRTMEALYAPAMYTGVKASKHPAAQAAEALGQSTNWLQRGDEIPLGDTGATLRVLAPASLYEDKDDNNSLVTMLESPQGKILLTGDMELPEEAELLGFGDDLKCAVLKVPNHADDDTTSAGFANACAAQIAVISTSSEEKPGTPDPGVVSRLEAAGSKVVVTEDSGLGVLVTLKGGVATASYVDFPYPVIEGPYIAALDVEDDRIILGNRGGDMIGLGLCYLYSDKGDELYVFPDGARIDAGGTLTVGTNSTDGDYDLLWDDKKVVHRKKTDVIYLYDSWGRIIDSRDNGK